MMNPSRALHQSTINFGRETPQATNPMNSPNTPPSQVNLALNSATIFPPVLIKAITHLGSKYASIACKSRNLVQRITTLNQAKEQGTIPLHMQYKFKKLLDTEPNTSLLATVIKASIDAEVTTLNEKVVELNNLYANRVQELSSLFAVPIRDTNFSFSNDQMVQAFDSVIQEKKLEFILKQQRDEERKKVKHEKFLSRKEEQDTIATLSVKQVQAFQKEIASLKSQINTLKLKSPKNKQGRGKPKNPSTGTTKGRNGKKQGTAKNK
jgi:hypothetical protein